MTNFSSVLLLLIPIVQSVIFLSTLQFKGTLATFLTTQQFYDTTPSSSFHNETTVDNQSEDRDEENGGLDIDDLTWDDATAILLTSFVIFTMQTGFGMLECGCVNVRSEANIMMKNFWAVDVVLGGFTYWLFGFSLSFGTDAGSLSPFLGHGSYLVDSKIDTMGPVFSAFMFQLSFATTATTIVSGTMAERCNFKAYCVFSLLNTVIYCVPARWVWSPKGFLADLGVIDMAGSGTVHLLGGVSGFTAAWMLGPRLGRYDHGIEALPPGNPSSCLFGLYTLWWGWLAFNSGSTFGVSGKKWKFAARAAVTTIIASFGGGIVGAVWSLMKPGSRILYVMDIVNPILGSLVGVTGGCALYHTIDAFIVGTIGGIVILLTGSITDRLQVDDPVGAICVHGFGGMWGLIAVGLFAADDGGLYTKGSFGLFRGGSGYLLAVQLLASLCIMLWAFTITFFLLWIINKLVPIRMKPHEELLGADFVEHLLHQGHLLTHGGDGVNLEYVDKIGKESSRSATGSFRKKEEEGGGDEVRGGRSRSVTSSVFKLWKKNAHRRSHKVAVTTAHPSSYGTVPATPSPWTIVNDSFRTPFNTTYSSTDNQNDGRSQQM